MTSKGRQAVRRAPRDLGLLTVERAYEAMSIDDEWSVREDRGFTWWGHWIRERIWADEAVRSGGETLWHVRARTPACRDVPDEPATYELVNAMNQLAALSAYAYDPEDGTISARCGAFVYEAVAGWLQSYLLTAAALQPSLAWAQVPAYAEGMTLDDAAHPSAGPRRDPDEMLSAAGSITPAPSPVTRRVLDRARASLEAEGFLAVIDREEAALQVLLPAAAGRPVLWILRSVQHPILGPGVVGTLVEQTPRGTRSAAWIANALNLAEAADWTGETRPHGLGAWRANGSIIGHVTFLPSQVIGRLKSDAAELVVRNLLAWDAVRARFLGDRLPWLESAAAARYPDDDPPDEDLAPEDAEDEEGDEDEGSGGSPQDHGEPEDSKEPEVPVADRGFGPAARTPRPRVRAVATRQPRELVVDPAGAAAFPEIDAAVAAAEDGDTIVVHPGTYRVPVVVDRAVRIEGRGDREDILLEPVGGEALGFAVSGAVVRGLTIRPARAGNDGADYSAVAFHDAEGTVEACHLTTHLGATVWVAGPAARARIRDCVIADGAQNAVWVVQEARAEVVGCRISGHRWPVIAGGAHAHLVVRESEIVDNLDHGVVAIERATLIVEGCTIARNAVSGVLLGGAAAASRVKDNLIEENGGTGVFVEGGRGRIVGNRIRRNDVGIGVVEGAMPTIEDNEIEANRLGLGVRGSGTHPRVSRNTITDCTDEGVIVDDEAAGRFEANVVRGCGGPGVRVTDRGSAPDLVGNHVAGSAVGVLVTGGAGGEFRSNDLRGNTRGSWLLEEAGPLARMDNLEDTGTTPTDLLGPRPGATDRRAPPGLLN